MRDLYDLSKDIYETLDGIKDTVSKQEGRITVLENNSKECKDNRRSWRDYIANAFTAVLAAIVAYIAGRYG